MKILPTRKAFDLLWLSKLAAGLVGAGAVLIFAGWAFGVESLIRLVPSMVVMNPLTALGFIFAGTSLLRLVRGQAGRFSAADGWARGLGALVALLGGLQITDYIFGLGLRLDHVLFPAKLAPAAGYPASELAPNTALAFLFCGLGLVLFDTETRRHFRPAQVLMSVVGLIALVALIGYAYRVLLFYRVGRSMPMSFDTALGFGLLWMGFVAAQPARGLMNILTSGTIGGAMARRLLPMAIFVPFVLGALVLIGEQTGFYGPEFALSLFAVGSLLIFTALIWWNAKLLHLADIQRARMETERTRAEEQLRETSANLARSNTELQQFAYVASHDLFEPLRMITSYLQLLEEREKGKIGPEANEFIGFALDGARRMDALIRDLLTYSRVDLRGRSFQPVDCEQVLTGAIANLKVAIQEGGGVITHGPMPQVMADRVQLTQVFQNLIGNAIKFHGTSPPRVEIGTERRGEEWVFSVRDNGIGIEAKHFERIFEIFQRLHTRQEFPGTGMGLAICKKIIERHGGRIWVESHRGQGSTFWFTLPAIPVEPVEEGQPDKPKLELAANASS